MVTSSDDDSEVTLIPDSVTNYVFLDKDDEPISFSDLPHIDLPNAQSPQVYIDGTAGDGLKKVYEPATAWKLEISRKTGPDVSVLLRGKWAKLLKPRRSYEGVIRSILISIQAMHFLKWNPNSLENSLWDNLKRVFDKFQVRPSDADFQPHIAFMKQFAEKDETLAKSQLLKGFLEGKGRRKAGEGNSRAPKVKEPFIADNDDEVEEMGDSKGDESGEEDADLFDSVCSICDNGGDLLCCEGECMRSFHATEEAGEDSACESLGFTSAEVEKTQNFLCENCKVKQHQCFACGKLGNSDKSKNAEVFQCSNATCGYFYHPKCVAKLLHPDDEAAAEECKKTVLEGRFACPYHRCFVCKNLEDKADPGLQFAMCRRCPRSYHRKCLPRKIAITADPENGMVIRAWEDLLPNRILIYCLKHKIDDQLLTPSRDHIVFPETFRPMQKSPSAKFHKSLITTSRGTSPADRRPLKKQVMVSEEGPSSKGRAVRNTSSQDKGKAVFLKKVKKLPNMKLQESHLMREDTSKAAVVCSRKPSPREVAKADSPSNSGDVPHSSFPSISADVQDRMKVLLKKESSSVTLEDVLRRHTIPRTHQNSGRHIDKVTLGKIEGSVEAIRTAYQSIIDGGSVEDAKAICEPEVVKQVAKWDKKLGVYLAPFLHGMRYTSFGRHFTKEEKLQEICNKLQWYVQTNDTIVDFGCGSNDFSRIMKEKMDAIGKRCKFQNYDIVQPKDDFCFEKRDWMTVQPNELPTGSQLIMGLNPPFGTKASLANKFIDKALTFKPKLVILIVPKETERLDQKRTQYDLVWVDNAALSGKSFYLPGSVDVDDKQMEQWNVSPPFLYLWSRPDWTARHKAIAEEHGHFSNLSEDMPASPPFPPPPSEEEQKKAKDIISQVVGDISVINSEVMTEVMEMRQEDIVSRKGKEKVDPSSPPEVESGVKTRPAVLRRKEGEDVGSGTTATKEVKKVDHRNHERQKNESLEGMGSHREVRGNSRHNDGRGVKADQKSGASDAHNGGAVRGPSNERRDNRYHNEGGASRNRQEARASVPHENFRGTGPHRIGKSPDVREGSIRNKTRSPDTREIRRRSPEMRMSGADHGRRRSPDAREIRRRSPEIRTSGADHGRRRSPPGVVESRPHKMRRSEDRAAWAPDNPDVCDMGISFPEENRQNNSAVRVDSTGTWENNNNPSRYNGSINRENDALRREDNDNPSRYNSNTNRENDSLQRENNSNHSRYYSSTNRENDTLQRENNNNPGRYYSSTNRENNNTLQRENNITAGGGTLPLVGSQYSDAPLMEQPVETRQLDSQLDFPDLGPIFSNGNDDFNDIARQYCPSPTSNWAPGSGLGSGSIMDYSRARGTDYTDSRGFDDFDGLGRFYGSHEENRHSNFGVGVSTFHNATSLSSYGLSGPSGSMTTSAMDRYAPRLDETNFLRPGGLLGQSGGPHQGFGGFGGLGGPPIYPYDVQGMDRREMFAPHPDPSGFGPRQPHSFQPPPGPSGGWLDD